MTLQEQSLIFLSGVKLAHSLVAHLGKPASIYQIELVNWKPSYYSSLALWSNVTTAYIK